MFWFFKILNRKQNRTTNKERKKNECSIKSKAYQLNPQHPNEPKPIFFSFVLLTIEIQWQKLLFAMFLELFIPKTEKKKKERISFSLPLIHCIAMHRNVFFCVELNFTANGCEYTLLLMHAI